jgi:hypothetical protein
MRRFWGVTDEQAAAHPSYSSLIRSSPHSDDRVMTPAELNAFYDSRVAAVRDGNEP